MASKGMKDISSAIDDAIDGPPSVTIQLVPTDNDGYNNRYANPQDDINQASGRDNEDDGADANEMGHQFATPDGGSVMSQSGQTNGLSPIQAAINHIQSGQASPQEMVMLQRILGK